MRRPWPSATGRERKARIAQAIDYAVRRTKYHYRDLEYAVSRSDPKFSDMYHSTLVLPFSWDRSVGIVTKLRARRPSIDVQFPEGKKFFFSNVKTSTLIFLFGESRGPFPRGSYGREAFVHRLHLRPMFRNTCSCISSSPHVFNT
jgi:hypothetical protein